MPQALPHALIRWQIRRQLIEHEREATLAKLGAASSDVARVAVEEKLRDLDRQLRGLGPEPSARMG